MQLFNILALVAAASAMKLNKNSDVKTIERTTPCHELSPTACNNKGPTEWDDLLKNGYDIYYGESVRFALPENPTTGITWTHDAPSDLITVDDKYVIDKHHPRMVGVGGTRYYKITAGYEEDQEVFHACLGSTKEKEASEATAPKFLSGEKEEEENCFDIDIRVWPLADLTNPEKRDFISGGFFYMYPGQLVKFITPSSPSTNTGYKLKNTSRHPRGRITFEPKKFVADDPKVRGGAGVDEWVAKAGSEGFEKFKFSSHDSVELNFHV